MNQPDQPQCSAQNQSPRQWSDSLSRVLLVVLLGFLFSVALSAQPRQEPTAVDDGVKVPLGAANVTITYNDLLANDINATHGTVTLIKWPIHGQIFLDPINARFDFVPTDDFWAIRSDLVVYRLDTPVGSSFATLYIVPEVKGYVNVTEHDFEEQGDLPPDATVGMTIETENPLFGEGSLSAVTSSGDVYGTLILPGPTHQAGGGNSGEVDGCVGGVDTIGGGYTSEIESDEILGYLMLFGDADATVDTAVVRVGVLGSGRDLFVEVKSVDAADNTAWHTSEILDRGNNIVRFSAAYSEGNGLLRAVLQADGLAVRTHNVEFHGAAPTHVRLGFFQADGPGSSANLMYDLLHLGTDRTKAIVSLGALLDPLQQADDFEDETLDAWTGSYGTVVQGAASALTGDTGLGVGFSSGSSFVSYQSAGTSGLQFRQLTARSTVDLSSFSIGSGRRLAIITATSDNHALFGTEDFELRLSSNGTDLLAAAFFLEEGGGWSKSSWIPVSGQHVFELQMGRSDGPGIDNGWMRLWKDGLPMAAVFGMANDDQALRNVHFGAKSFDPAMVLGTVHLDDTTVTR